MPVPERQDFGKIKPATFMLPYPVLKPLAAGRQRQVTEVLIPVEQHVIDPHKGWQIAKMRLCRCLAIEPLLQAVEGERLEIMADQQFTVENGMPVQRRREIGKGDRDIIAGPSKDTPAFAIKDKLHADAIPFPFSLIVAGIEPVEITRLVDRV